MQASFKLDKLTNDQRLLVLVLQNVKKNCLEKYSVKITHSKHVLKRFVKIFISGILDRKRLVLVDGFFEWKSMDIKENTNDFHVTHLKTVHSL